jgi:hypothetical protein
MRITARMPSAEGVAPGQTATFRLPIGRTFHTLLLGYAGVTLAQMTEARIVANGQVVRRYAGGGAKINLMNLFCGLAAADGVLRIDFDRPGMRLKDGEEYTSFGTGVANDPTPITTLTMEIDISAAAIAPVLALKAIQSEPRPFGLVSKLREFVYNAPAAGDYEIVDLPKGDLIGKIFIQSANITRLKIERDGFVIFERTAAENNVVQLDGYRVPQAGYFVFDPSENGFAGEAVQTGGVQDLRLICTMSGAEALPITVEYIGPLVG